MEILTAMHSSVVWPYRLLSHIWPLDSTLLILVELPIFKIWFLIPNTYFPSFIIVWENVLSYIIACFGNDLQRDRNPRSLSGSLLIVTLRCSDSYIQGCTVWGSFSRGLSMSGTLGLKVDSNVFYDILGHALLVGKWNELVKFAIFE